MTKGIVISDAEYLERRLRVADKVGCQNGNVFILHYQEEGNFVNGKHFPHHLSRWLNLPLEEGDWTFVMYKSNFNDMTMILSTNLDQEPDIWSGKDQINSREASVKYGVTQTIDNEDLYDLLHDLIIEKRKASFYYHFLGQKWDHSEVEELIRSLEPIVLKKDQNFFSAEMILDELRLIKSTTEIQLIQAACQISIEAHKRIVRELKPGINEQHLDGIFTGYVIYHGCERTAYPNIVASGLNSTILHYAKNNRIMKTGDLLLIDAGSQYCGYASDITRTYPVSGTFTPEQLDIYNLVLKIQKKCIEAAIPGASFKVLQELAGQMVHDGLSKLGLIEDKDPETSLCFFMHGIGHWVGLQVHDCHTIPDTQFQPGMVITVEPGIYIGNYSISNDSKKASINEHMFNKYYGIGIRIEDVVLITKDQPTILSHDLPKEVKDIEKKVPA